MGKGMAHLAGQRLPIGGQRRRAFGARLCRIDPVRTGPTKHPAKQPFVGPCFKQPRAILALRQIDGAVADGFRLFRGLLWQKRRCAFCPRDAGFAPRADATGRGLRRADCSAQIHHGLGIVSGPVLRGQRDGPRHQLGLRSGQGRVDVIDPRHHPLDIAIKHRMGQIERDGGDRRRRIRPDARQFQQRIMIRREAAAMLCHHRTRAFQQVAGAGVIAKARPFGHHIGILCRGKGRHIRPAGGEPREIVFYRGDSRLLQHDLAQPDAVGVGHDPGHAVLRRHPPRQGAGVGVVPFQQDRRQLADGGLLTQCLGLSTGQGLVTLGQMVMYVSTFGKQSHAATSYDYKRV